MNRIVANGVLNLCLTPGGSAWYWGADYASGDLHGAEELFHIGHPIRKNRVLLARCPELFGLCRTTTTGVWCEEVYIDVA